MSYGKELLSNSGVGNGSDVIISVGGKFAFIADATWGGGNVKLQVKTPRGNYADVSSSTLSANGMLNVDLPAGTYRAVVTTATACYAWLAKIPN